jgi:gas vesicle protein GvpL/GvpF
VTQPNAVYVYGVLPATDAERLPAAGIEGSNVRAIVDGELAAVVSDLAGESLNAAREVRAHWRVLDAVAKEATALPVRFGTALRDDDDVRARLLAPNRERLVALLRHLSGRVQLGVKGRYDEQALLREIVATSKPVAALRERIRGLPAEAAYYDSIRLGELVAGEVDLRRQRDTQHALGALAPHAVEAREQAAGGEDGAFDLAFLVERGRIDSFSKAVVKLGEDVGDRIALRYVGPLPPYSFADAELDTGSAAWA